MQPLSKSNTEHSLLKIVVWTLFFQLAWSWRRIVPVFQQGELTGPDDFLRLTQVKNWMAGQGWYDLSLAQMSPPTGADIHWSRLVDVPIAGMIWLLDLVFDTETAIRITTILWPTLLLVAVIVVMTLICDRLLKEYNRLLPLLFSILCISSVYEFTPGRIDHHNVQILLFSLTILALVSRDTPWGNYLLGFTIALSISIGLDTAMLFVVILAYLAYEWAIGKDVGGRDLRMVALAISGSTVVLFLLNFDPGGYFSQGLDSRCDANSAFYATGLLLLSGAFFLLAGLSGVLVYEGAGKQFAIRALVGVVIGVAAITCLLVLFPDCAAGPYGALSEEAKTRWLENVSEAKSLPELLRVQPSEWLRTVGYLVVVLGAGLIVLFHPKYTSAKLVALYVVLLVCALGTVWQNRTLRTGIYVSIPFCVILADMSWRALVERFGGARPLAYLLQCLVVASLVSLTWSWAGLLVFGDSKAVASANVASAKTPADDIGVQNTVEKKPRNAPDNCFAADDYKFLAGLPTGIVMTDLYSATAALSHSSHTVIAGPYHRNERAIMDVLDFFGTDTQTAFKLVDKYKLDYVTYCTNFSRFEGKKSAGSIMGKILHGNLPSWLEEISPDNAITKVFRIVR